MTYFDLFKKSMHVGVCHKMRSKGIYEIIVKQISDFGCNYSFKNKNQLKKMFPLCFKSAKNKLQFYWCDAIPLLSKEEEEERKQSLEIRLYILRIIKAQLDQ